MMLEALEILCNHPLEMNIDDQMSLKQVIASSNCIKNDDELDMI